MKKRAILCVFIALTVVFSAFSDEIKITGTAPVFEAVDPSVASNIPAFNNALKDLFEGDILSGIEDLLTEALPEGFSTDKLLTGFGAASIYASHGATMRAYADYKSFSISAGAMVGFKLPEGSAKLITSSLRSGAKIDSQFVDGLLDLADKDPTVGIIPQVLNLNIGFRPYNFFKILPKNLFLGLRAGYTGYPGGFELEMENGLMANIAYDSFVLGVSANYQLIPTASFPFGLVRWRGINIGSGFIYSSTKLDCSIPLEKISQQISGGSLGTLNGLNLEMDPRANFKLEVTTFTIPVEISTAISFLIVNIPIGFGFDIGFGKSSIASGMTSDINITGGASADLIRQASAGSLEASINNSIDVNVFNYKLMTGIGLTFGDAFVIDIPVTYYFDDGFNVGVTLGFRF